MNDENREKEREGKIPPPDVFNQIVSRIWLPSVVDVVSMCLNRIFSEVGACFRKRAASWLKVCSTLVTEAN